MNLRRAKGHGSPNQFCICNAVHYSNVSPLTYLANAFVQSDLQKKVKRYDQQPTTANAFKQYCISDGTF